jgi:hypothetical protein
MPLQKLQFRPGVNRESTTLANEGGWFDSDKIRFRSGQPEKIGGWIKDSGVQNSTAPVGTFVAGGTVTSLSPTSGSFWGVCRSLWNWLNLVGYNLMGIGTNLKYYIQNGVNGGLYDITPIRTATSAGEATFSATNGSAILTVTDAGHGAQAGDFVVYTNAVALGGNITAAVLNAEFQIATYISPSQYTIVASVVSNFTGTGGGSATVATYQITSGNETYTQNVGWGAGGWGGLTTGYAATGWGSPAPAGIGIGSQLRVWSQTNYGEDLIFNPRGGALYYWANAITINTFNRGQLLGPNATVVTKNGSIVVDGYCPSIANIVLVSDSSRFVIAFGCNNAVAGSSVQNPMFIAWSDQEDFATWYPQATNQAGSYTLSNGSQIITAIQNRQEILVLTDSAIYSMQYLGPPYVWGFQIMGDNISIVGPNAITTVNNITYWMGADKFYMYSGRVETLPCTLRQYVYDDINLSQSYQFFSSTNEGYNEIWWFYCSAGSTTVDKYVIFNHLERTWCYGTLGRSAWIDSPLRATPMATAYSDRNGLMVYHEVGNDDGTTNPASPITAYVQSSDFDIGDGHNFGLVTRVIPDVTFDSSTVNAPALNFEVLPRQFPGTAYGAADSPTVVSAQNYQNQATYNVQEFTEQVFVRVRGRQMAFKVISDGLGVSWQLGVPRIDIRPDGRR